MKSRLAALLLIMTAAAPAWAQAPGAVTSSTITRYVAPDGNPAWSGQLARPNAGKTDGPFASLDQARAWVRSLGKLPDDSQIVIQVEGGTYYLAAPLTFTAADSGTKSTEVVYENYSGDQPLISGGMRVQNWTQTPGTNLWKASLPASTRSFENLYYNGVRRLRPRVSTGTASAATANLGTYLRVVSPVYVPTESDACPAPAVPGKGYVCFDRFVYGTSSSANLLSSKWKNLTPPASPANPDCDPANGSTAPVGDIELLIFEQFTASHLRISCIDSKHQIVYLTGTTNIPSAANRSQGGFITGHRYLVENVEDALTSPG
jgi:hypothetical protein